MSDSLFEADVTVKANSTAPAKVLRGKFPDVDSWHLNLSNLREVLGGFVNYTNLVVPKPVCWFLSTGPKFMLPSFSLLSAADKRAAFKSLRDDLEKVPYLFSQCYLDYQMMVELYEEHAGDRVYISMMSRKLLKAASMTSNFLQTKQGSCVLVEADKGKRVALVYRSEFVDLNERFFSAGLVSGEYILFF